MKNLHRQKDYESVFLDCYGGGTYINGENQKNKTFRPDLGSTIIVLADFSTGKVTWKVEDGDEINEAVLPSLTHGLWHLTILMCYADDKVKIIK
jgi:hypothetical protein